MRALTMAIGTDNTTWFALRISYLGDQLFVEMGKMGDKGTRNDSEFGSLDV